MKVERSPGTVADRIAILEIKVRRLPETAAISQVEAELASLRAAWRDHGLPDLETLPEWADLVRTNEQLWDVEDVLRTHERRGDFGPTFVAHARSVYRLNDERSRLKTRIDVALGDGVGEVKWYG